MLYDCIFLMSAELVLRFRWI
uniref:Uncharacterized protein n=1 Tax=Anguilla anguilla TaxID=7936 RepID=A0A0E9VZQ3_ANGAN